MARKIIHPDTGEPYTLDMTAELQADLQQHWETGCKHPEREIRRAILSKGSIQFRHQCLTCGERVGLAIKKSQAPVDCPELDTELAESYRQRREAALEQVYLKHLRAQKESATGFQEKYDAYLRSEAWAEKRLKVLNRVNSTCEGCLEAPATEVHHKTYVHVFDELLYELVALCDDCHRRAHVFDAVTELDYRELICSSCRFGSWSEIDGAICAKFDTSSGKALAKGGPCGPHAREFEPLK